MARVAAVFFLAMIATLGGCSERVHGNALAEPPQTTPNVITEQAKETPDLRLRFGEPATFVKGGVSVTVTPKSFQPTTPTAGELGGRNSPGTECGHWWTWKVDVEIRAKTDATWDRWDVPLVVGLDGLIPHFLTGLGGKHDEFDRMYLLIPPHSDQIDTSPLAQAEGKYRAWAKDPGEEFHAKFPYQRTVSACQPMYAHYHPGAPDWTPPLGLGWQRYTTERGDVRFRVVWLL